MKVNLEGTTDFERALLEEDTYFARVKEITDIKPYQKFNKPNETEDKFSMIFEVKLDDGSTKDIPEFLKPIITKGDGGKYSNSKLYDELSAAGFLKLIKDDDETFQDNTYFIAWMRDQFITKAPTFKILLKTVGKSSTPYSVVSKIVKVVNSGDGEPQVEKEIDMSKDESPLSKADPNFSTSEDKKEESK